MQLLESAFATLPARSLLPRVVTIGQELLEEGTRIVIPDDAKPPEQAASPSSGASSSR